MTHTDEVGIFIKKCLSYLKSLKRRKALAIPLKYGFDFGSIGMRRKIFRGTVAGRNIKTLRKKHMWYVRKIKATQCNEREHLQREW